MSCRTQLIFEIARRALAAVIAEALLARFAASFLRRWTGWISAGPCNSDRSVGYRNTCTAKLGHDAVRSTEPPDSFFSTAFARKRGRRANLASRLDTRARGMRRSPRPRSHPMM